MTATEDGGWTKSYRRKWKNPVFRNFRDVGVWSYLTDNAAWADNTVVRFADRMVTLMRGQIVTSERFLAEGFCCDRQVIRRILDALENNQMATRQQTHGGTIITICNYEEYQSRDERGKPTAPTERTHVEPTSNPNNKEEKNLKNQDLVIDTAPERVSHIDVTRNMLEIMGLTLDEPRWFGSMARVEMWLKRGWSPENLIYPAVRQMMHQRGSQGPPDGIEYVEKVIVSFSKRLDRDVPEIVNVNGNNGVQNVSSPNRGNGRQSAHNALAEGTARAMASARSRKNGGR